MNLLEKHQHAMELSFQASQKRLSGEEDEAINLY